MQTPKAGKALSVHALCVRVSSSLRCCCWLLEGAGLCALLPTAGLCALLSTAGCCALLSVVLYVAHCCLVRWRWCWVARNAEYIQVERAATPRKTWKKHLTAHGIPLIIHHTAWCLVLLSNQCYF